MRHCTKTLAIRRPMFDNALSLMFQLMANRLKLLQLSPPPSSFGVDLARLPVSRVFFCVRNIAFDSYC